ncbi:hypothetical protein ATX59_07230 [Oenococcus oeni]|uniref:DUF4044 domain-containing protein n=1 Tax=Oenococcus oeni TaxID=1247 RepID=A0A6N4A7R6_OENOE|nr:hypothetical protein [Oenococcus oeni]OIM20887.1 hypothetical protein ATX59_07230 [Oenococcus oeni]
MAKEDKKSSIEATVKSPLQENINHDLSKMRYQKKSDKKSTNKFSNFQLVVSFIIVVIVISGIVYSLFSVIGK